MLTRTIKMAFWIVYDHTGTIIVAGLIWSFAVYLPLLMLVPVLFNPNLPMFLTVCIPAAVLASAIAALMSAGIAHMTKTFIETKDGSLADFLTGIRRFGIRAALAAVIYLAAAACILTGAVFYATRLANFAPWLGYTLAGVMLWCLFFLILTAVFTLPVITRKQAAVLAAIKLSCLLVLDNPALALGVFISILLPVPLIILLPPLALFYGPAAVIIASCAYEMLARKYDAIDRGTPDPSRSVSIRQGRLIFNDQADDYLNRGFKDFLFPWKG